MLPNLKMMECLRELSGQMKILGQKVDFMRRNPNYGRVMQSLR
jgi:hypothetical protein